MKNSKLHTTEDKSNEKVTSSNSKSEDEQLMEVMLYVRTTHEVEHNDNQWTREFVYSFDEAKSKINRLIAEQVVQELWLVPSSPSVNGYIRKRIKELGDSNE